MRRIKDYCRFVVWQTGLSYLLLWAVTLWTLDEGAAVFGKSGVCHPNPAKALFYWVCDASSPLSILATVANVALTATVWAPVYIAAAASGQSDAMALAGPIIAIHVVGFPLALFVLVKTVASLLDYGRKSARGRAEALGGVYPGALEGGLPPASSAAVTRPRAKPAMPAPPRPRKIVPPRSEFGLRSPVSRRSKPAAT